MCLTLAVVEYDSTVVRWKANEKVLVHMPTSGSFIRRGPFFLSDQSFHSALLGKDFGGCASFLWEESDTGLCPTRGLTRVYQLQV